MFKCFPISSYRAFFLEGINIALNDRHDSIKLSYDIYKLIFFLKSLNYTSQDKKFLIYVHIHVKLNNDFLHSVSPQFSQ